jgi:G3E family GTPase
MSTPFERASTGIAVTVVTGVGNQPLPLDSLARGTPTADLAVVRLRAPMHEHAGGDNCVACASAGDVRLALFDLLQSPQRPSRVVVDARGLADPAQVIERLIPGRQPATALRDHTVARSFHLFEVVEMAG